MGGSRAGPGSREAQVRILVQLPIFWGEMSSDDLIFGRGSPGGIRAGLGGFKTPSPPTGGFTKKSVLIASSSLWIWGVSGFSFLTTGLQRSRCKQTT